jgi:hypothetical protein
MKSVLELENIVKRGKGGTAREVYRARILLLSKLSLPICTTTIQWKSFPVVPSALLFSDVAFV